MFGYAKPVPYDPNSLNDKRFGPAKVALAGPAVNFTLAIMAGALIRYLGTDISPLFSNMLAYVVWINLILGLFNLIPVPPLDGHWLLMTFLPASWYGLKIALYRYQLILIALVIFYVFPALNPLMNSLFTLLTGYRLF